MHFVKFCKNVSTPLLLTIFLAAIVYFVNTEYWAHSAKRMSQLIPQGDIDRYRDDPAPQDSKNFCPYSTLKAVDILNVMHFKSRCHLTRLTSLPGNFTSSTSLNRNGLRSHLSHIAKNPHGSLCTCPRTLKIAPFYPDKVALLSFPGSGNTWMRHLIQQLTGIYTGSVYKSPGLNFESEIFVLEGVITRVSVIKTHRPPSPDGLQEREYADGTAIKLRFDKLLIVLRDPFKSLVAEFKRNRLKLGKVGNTVVNSSDDKWIRFFEFRSKNWGLFVEKALNTTLPYTVIYYEDLRSCLMPELVKIASFLRHEKLNEFSFCCTLKEQEGSFHRSASTQTPEDIYSLEHRRALNQIILKTSENIKKIDPSVAERILTYMMT